MSVVTHKLAAIERGDPKAADQLLPLVYHELRRLAAQRLAHERPGQTLQATALVHEAYVRLVGSGAPPRWERRGRRARRLHLHRREGLGLRPELAPAGDRPQFRPPAQTDRGKNRYGFGPGFSHYILDGPGGPPRRLP